MSIRAESRKRRRMLAPALDQRLQDLIVHLKQAPWPSMESWCHVPRNAVVDGPLAFDLGWITNSGRPTTATPLRWEVFRWARYVLDAEQFAPLTVTQAIQRLERNRESLVEQTVAFALHLIEALVGPNHQLAVLERPMLAASWPWPLDSVDGALAHLLTALCPTTAGEGLCSMWPPDTSLELVVEWTRPHLNAIDAVPRPSTWLRLDPCQGAPILLAKHAESWKLIPSSALAHLYQLEQEVLTAQRIPRVRIDAGQIQQGVIAGHSHMHQALDRDSIFPREGTAYSPAQQTLEVLLPSHHQFGIVDSQTTAQLTLPGIPDPDSLPAQIAGTLQAFYRYAGLRHWTGFLVLLSRAGHTGWVRWTLRSALDAMKLAGSPKNRALAMDMIELFTKLELTVWNEKAQRRRRNPLVYWKNRDEVLGHSRWEITGIDLHVNPAIYNGCGGEEGGNNYALAPVELATLETNRWGPAVPLGLQLPARWLYESRRRGSTMVILSGRELLRMAGLKYEHSSRTWKRLQRNLDKLGSIDALGDWSWDVGPSLDTRCQIRAPDWMVDRTLRQLKPRLRQISVSIKLTGTELGAWRKRRGLTQQQAADDLGVSRRRYGDQERRGDQPVSAQLRRAFERLP